MVFVSSSPRVRFYPLVTHEAYLGPLELATELIGGVAALQELALEVGSLRCLHQVRAC